MKEQGVYSPSKKQTLHQTRTLLIKEIIENCDDYFLQ